MRPRSLRLRYLAEMRSFRNGIRLKSFWNCSVIGCRKRYSIYRYSWCWPFKAPEINDQQTLKKSIQLWSSVEYYYEVSRGRKGLPECGQKSTTRVSRSQTSWDPSSIEADGWSYCPTIWSVLFNFPDILLTSRFDKPPRLICERSKNSPAWWIIQQVISKKR